MSNLFKKVTSTVSAISIVAVAMGSTLTAFAASEFAMYAEELATAGVINTQASEAGFRLGDNITRSEMAKIAVKLAEGETADCAGNVFADVNAAMGDLCGYVEAAADLGIVSTVNAKFRPMDLVTRAEMVKMLLAARGVATTDISAGFSDVPSSMGDLAGYINAAVAEGLIKAGTTFRPNATATRGEAFKVAAGAMALDTDGEVTPPVDNNTGNTNTGSTNSGVTVGGDTNVATGGLTVSLNPATPVATTLATGSAYNKVLVVDMKAGSADATVTGVEVTRTGLISNTNISGVSVWVDGARIGNVAQSLTSDGMATVTFGTTPLQIMAGTTKTVTIALNVRAGVYSGTVGLTLSKVMAGGTVTGAPVSSATHSVVDGAQALVQYNVSAIAVGGGLTEGAAVSLDIGQATELAKFKVEQTNSKEDLVVEGMNVFIEGSVADGDLDMFQIVSQEGNTLATAMSSVGRYVNFKFTTPYIIPQGSSRFFTVKATVANGKYNANRTYSAKIRDDFDIVARGTTTGTYVLAATIPTTQYWFKVREGTVTVAKATDSRSQSAAPGIDDVVLATFDVKASGEDMEFQKLNFKVTKAGGAVDLRGTLKLTVDGITVFSTDAANAANYAAGANSGYLSTYFTVKAGATAKVAVVASISTTATAGHTYTASIFDASFKLISSNTIKSLALAGTNGNAIAVENVTLTASANGSFPSSSIVKGQTNAKIGSFNLQASNADDLNVTTARVGLVTTPAATVTGINNLTLKVGTTSIASAIANPTATGNTFSINGGALKVPANSTVTVDVYADVTSAATATDVRAELEANGTSAVGTKTSVSVTGPGVPSQSAITNIVGNGTLTVEADSLTPAKQILVAGMTNVEVLRFKVRADNKEDIRLDKLDIGLGTGPTTTDLGKSFTNVKLFDGSTQIGSGNVTFVSDTAKFTGLNLIVPKSGTKSISVRVDTTASSSFEKTKIATLAPRGMEYTGAAGGSLTPFATILATVAPSNAMTLHDVKPTIIKTSPSGTVAGNANAGETISTYSVKADGTRDLIIRTLSVKTSGSTVGGAVITSVELWYNNQNAANTVASINANGGTAAFTLTTPVTVTAGNTVTFSVKANTSGVRAGATTQKVTLGTFINGVQGGAGDLGWDYIDSNGIYGSNPTNAAPAPIALVNQPGAANLNISDSYQVTGGTLEY